MTSFAGDDRDGYSDYGLEVPTSNDCPVWCVDAVGHGYDDEAVPGHPSRWHDGFSADIETGETSRNGRKRHLSVSLAARETADARTGAVMELDRPEIWLHGDFDRITLTSAEARLLAQHLLKAAERQSAIGAFEGRD